MYNNYTEERTSEKKRARERARKERNLHAHITFYMAFQL